MKPIKILAILAITIVGSLTITPSIANAGFVDWVTEDSKNEDINIKKSFGYVFALFDDSDTITENTAPYTEPVKEAQKTEKIQPVKKQFIAKQQYTVEMTGYSSEVAQTDDSPFITASNTYVRDGIVALNGFPFKTKVQFPELFPGRTFVVEDRMNRRYNFENTGKYRVDVWFSERNTAIQFGYKRAVTMVVVAETDVTK